MGFNGDGKLDVVVREATGKISVLHVCINTGTDSQTVLGEPTGLKLDDCLATVDSPGNSSPSAAPKSCSASASGPAPAGPAARASPTASTSGMQSC